MEGSKKMISAVIIFLAVLITLWKPEAFGLSVILLISLVLSFFSWLIRIILMLVCILVSGFFQILTLFLVPILLFVFSVIIDMCQVAISEIVQKREREKIIRAGYVDRCKHLIKLARGLRKEGRLTEYTAKLEEIKKLLDRGVSVEDIGASSEEIEALKLV